MGVNPIYVAARSPEKLKAMSKYGIVFINSAEEAQKITVGPVYAVSTIPGNVHIDENLSTTVSSLLSSPSSAVERQFLEMAYLPRETVTMKMAMQLGWETIPGAVPLTLQGLRQFELWTGFKVPTSLGQRAVDGDANGADGA
jgi:shikimate 5-dehydrogenase